MTTRTPKLPPRIPQADRRHFVFVDGCGCPTGVADQTPRCKDEDAAWDAMYDSRADERAARARGIHVVYVDHATYEKEWYPLMLTACPHR